MSINPSMSPFRMATSVLAVAMGAGAVAAQDQSDATYEDVEELVVWGTRIRSSSIYLGEQDIAIKQADHLSDLLRPLPGVDIGGTHSVNTRINFRGLDDRNLAVYIDGALQTNYLYHHMGNLLINPDVLKSADVQLGANSMTHGGIGGAVRFDTVDAADMLAGGRDFGARVSGTYHSNDMQGVSGTAYGQITDAFDLLGYANYVDRGNFTDGSDRETIGSDGETTDILVKAGFNVAENQRFELSYNRFSDEGDYTQRPDMGVLTNEAITGDILLPTEYERETWTAKYEGDFGDAFRLDATVYMNDMRLWRDETNPDIPRSLGATREAQADNTGAYILATSGVETGGLAHAFKYGMEYFDQDQTYLPDSTDDSTAQLQNARLLAFFAEDEIALGEYVVLRPGLRYTDYKLEYEQTGADGSWSKLTYGLGGEVKVTDGLRLVANYTSLFRGPELAEVFVGTGSNKLVNPDVEAETGENIELGFRLSEEIGAAQLNVGANLFWTTIKDFLAEVSVPGTTTSEVWDTNIGDAKLSGVEASANLRYNGWDALVTFSSSDLNSDDLDSTSTTESLREIGDQLGAELSYTFTGLDLFVGWNMQYVFEKTTVTGDVKPSYTVHNLTARWDSPVGLSGASVIFGVDNLLDKTYTSHASRTGATFHPVFGALVLNDVEPGRNIKLTLSQRF